MTDAPPHDPDAERATIGAVLMSERAADEVHAIVRPSDFYQPKHEAILGAALALRDRREPVDAVTVAAELTRTGDIARAGGHAYLHDCLTAVTTAASAGHHARIVREKSELRAVREAGLRMAQLAVEAGDGSADTIKAVARQILDNVDSREARASVIGDVIDGVLDEAEEGVQSGFPTPWPELDEATTGLRPGAVYTIGARPGVGKSVIAASLAWHTAKLGRTALLHSLEMSKQDVTRRMISAVASVDYGRLLRGRLSEVEWHRIAKVRAQFSDLPFVIDDKSSVTVGDVSASARLLARDGNLGLVVVDYLQLMTPTDRRAPREQQVAECSRQLKILAGDLGVPVVMLSQLNRQVESRADKHPTLSDLRESGAVEQDSDVVLLLYRDVEQAPDIIEVGVAKNRFGSPTGIQLMWEGHFQRAVSPEHHGNRWTEGVA